jgi:hypothetical protein
MVSHLAARSRIRGKAQRWLVALMGALGLGPLGVACGETADLSRCAAGLTAPCACTNGDMGTQLCGQDGTFEPCLCSAEGGASR